MALEVQYESANTVPTVPSNDGAVSDSDFNGVPDDVAVLVWDDTNNVLLVRKPNGDYREVATTAPA